MVDTHQRRLFTQHPLALQTLFGDLERWAMSQPESFVGTAGSVIERSNASGFAFYAHQSYDGDGKRRERYVAGPVGAPEAEAAAAALRDRIEDTKRQVSSLRLLAREGFAVVDTRTSATLSSLANHGVFRAGGMLIGSHAYGVIINRMGIHAAAYATEDVDIARREALAFGKHPGVSFFEMLSESGIRFFEVPDLDRKRPTTSYAKVGRSTFIVDLLVPSRDESFPVVPVPELKAHATGLPYLGYLLAESQLAALLAKEGACTVRVPLPERFALHKLLVSQLRSGRSAKAQKDLQQAAVLAAALAEHFPGALEEARSKIPKRAAKYLRRALPLLHQLTRQHPRVIEELP